MSTPGNPLMGSWGPTPGLFSTPTAPQINTGQWGNPGNLQNPFSNAKDITRNTGLENLLGGQYLNSLMPMFANNMFQYGGNAANVMGNFANLGSPYYQGKQAEQFNQGVLRNQD